MSPHGGTAFFPDGDYLQRWQCFLNERNMHTHTFGTDNVHLTISREELSALVSTLFHVLHAQFYADTESLSIYLAGVSVSQLQRLWLYLDRQLTVLHEKTDEHSVITFTAIDLAICRDALREALHSTGSDCHSIFGIWPAFGYALSESLDRLSKHIAAIQSQRRTDIDVPLMLKAVDFGPLRFGCLRLLEPVDWFGAPEPVDAYLVYDRDSGFFLWWFWFSNFMKYMEHADFANVIDGIGRATRFSVGPYGIASFNLQKSALYAIYSNTQMSDWESSVSHVLSSSSARIASVRNGAAESLHVSAFASYADLVLAGKIPKRFDLRISAVENLAHGWEIQLELEAGDRSCYVILNEQCDRMLERWPDTTTTVRDGFA